MRGSLLRVALLAGMPVLSTAAIGQDLTGAGSSFVNPIMQTWVAKYREAKGISINYQSIGSGGGISALINKTVDFAASDAPMSPDEMKEAGAPVLHIPVVIGTECVSYNLPGIPGGLRMTGQVLAEIYLGKITDWNDPSIAALNPRTPLPRRHIFVVHRSDGSGTTYIFTDYLAKVSPEFKQVVGVGKSVRWPVGLGAKGNESVAEQIRQRPYSIGYIELAYALQNRINSCVMRNAKGRYVPPAIESGSITAAGIRMPADMRVSITNSLNEGGYPITGFTWILVYQHPLRASQVRNFLQWVVTTGQAYTAGVQYAGVPEKALLAVHRIVNSIH